MSLLLLFSSSFAFADEYIVDIPFGTFNPKLNTPAEIWRDPFQIFVSVDDTIIWYNDDREGHTVTSGEGSGRFDWMDDNFGNSDAQFDSARFMPDESWLYKFEKHDIFSYYCTIHPWMEGIVIVEKNSHITQRKLGVI